MVIVINISFVPETQSPRRRVHPPSEARPPHRSTRLHRSGRLRVRPGGTEDAHPVRAVREGVHHGPRADGSVCEDLSVAEGFECC